MLSSEHKKFIADTIQAALQSLEDWELPNGKISFILHVDGHNPRSWANIKGKPDAIEVPCVLKRNLTVSDNGT